MSHKFPNLSICQDSQSQKKGSYAVVKKLIDTKTNKLYALKQLTLGHVNGEITPYTIREISLQKEISDSPYILKIQDFFSSKGKFFFLFEFYQCNLKELLLSYSLTLTQARILLFQLLKGMEFAHSRRIMHRDIKPENILLKRTIQQGNYHLVVADWGLARNFHFPYQSYTLEVVSFAYRAPELLLGKKIYTQKIDVWSIGCVFFELLTNKILFLQHNQLNQLMAIISCIGCSDSQTLAFLADNVQAQVKNTIFKQESRLRNILAGADSKAIDLLQKMLAFNPEQRISCSDALKHAFFSGLS